jgi:hypothetical protein
VVRRRAPADGLRDLRDDAVPAALGLAIRSGISGESTTVWRTVLWSFCCGQAEDSRRRGPCAVPPVDL